MTPHIVTEHPTTHDDERPALPTCVNHPGRQTAGTFDGEGYCYECVEPELRKRRLWLRSFAVVRGGVEALRP